MTSAPATPLAALNGWFTPKRFALVLLLSLLAAFPDVVLLGRSFFFRDYSFFSVPLAFYQKECFWRGELPFWNSYHNMGQPFLAQWNTMSLYPGSLIYLLFPLPWSLNFFCLLHLFLGGMGMYFLARHLLDHNAAASFAGLGYIFNAFTLNCLMYPHNIAAWGWLPWILWGSVLACRHGGRAMPLTVLAGAMQFLTGGAELTLQTWFLAGCFVIFDCWQNGWNPKAPVRLVAIVLLVTALSAAQLLPFLDLLVQSQRDKTASADLWSMPAWGWLNLFVPKFGSYVGPQGVYSQHGQAWMNTYYPGCIVTLLAIFAWWRSREKLILGGWLLIVVSLAIAQGGEGITYAHIKAWIPQLGYIRYPVKFIAMTIILLPILAGVGLRSLLTHASTEDEGTLVRKLSLLTAILAFLSILAARLDLYLQIPYVDWETTLYSGLKCVLVFVVAAFLLISVRRAITTDVTVKLFLGFLAVIWADQVIVNHRPSPTTRSWVYQPDIVRQRLGLELAEGPGSSRFRPDARIMNELGSISLAVPEEQVAYYRMACFDNLNLFDHIPQVHGFYPMDLKYFRELLDWFYAEPEEHVRSLIEFSGVAYTQAPKKPVEWTKKWDPQPLITAGQKPVKIAENGVFGLLEEGTFKPAQEVYLYPSEADDLQDVIPGLATVESIEWKEQSIRFKVNAAQPSMVVLAQTYYHPWIAEVSGAVTPLRRANHSFTALKVPAGNHEVRLTYVDRKFRLGAMISIGTLIGVIAMLALSFRTTQPAIVT